MSQSLTRFEIQDLIVGHITNGCTEGKCLEEIEKDIVSDRHLSTQQRSMSLFRLALKTGCSVEVLEYLENLDPRVITTTNEYEETPLHSACSSWGQPQREVLEHLVELDPSALTYRDDDYGLPLHSLVLNENEPSVGALEYIIKSYPDGVKAKDIHGETPLAILTQNDFHLAVSFHTYDPDRDTNSSYTRQQKKEKWQEERLFAIRQEMITMLVDEYPEALHIVYWTKERRQDEKEAPANFPNDESLGNARDDPTPKGAARAGGSQANHPRTARTEPESLAGVGWFESIV